MPHRRRPRPDIAVLVDGAVGDRVVVYGSLPPAGADLDIVARAPEHHDLTVALAAAGFRRHGVDWIRFTHAAADAVEVTAVRAWGLTSAAEDALFTEAVLLPGHRHLSRPAPHHVLLLLADRVARQGVLTPGDRARLDAALVEDPDAWEEAANTAVDWRVASGLSLLRSHHHGQPTTLSRRAAAAMEAIGSGATTTAMSTVALRGWLAAAAGPPRERGGIVALSGLDGSGKSSQADALVSALDSIGRPAAVEWARLAYDPTLDRLAAPIKRLLGRGRDPDEQTGAGGSTRIAEDTGEATPRHVVVDLLWAIIVALVDTRAHRARVRPHLRAGRVVICDRYVLDSTVHLAERFSGWPLRTAVGLTRTLSPRPLRAWYLRVPPETAYDRKPQEFAVPRLRRHATLYDSFHDELGVVRLDGTRARQELSTEIGHEVWSALAERGRWPLLRRLLRRR